MMEFAPAYGGLVFAISNTVSNFSGFLAPISQYYIPTFFFYYVYIFSKSLFFPIYTKYLCTLIATGRLINGENTISRWQLAFWISAIVNIPGLIAFQIFGTDKIQSWAQ